VPTFIVGKQDLLMQLSADDYRSMVESLRPSDRRQMSDKRLHLRIGADADVTIVPLIASGGSPNGLPQPISVHVVEVSRNGLAIQHVCPFDVGQQFILCLSRPDCRMTCSVMCVVRRVGTINGSGRFRIGCELIGHVHPEVPTDEILPGLQRFQTERFALDTQ
jgi:hypothetical protein